MRNFIGDTAKSVTALIPVAAGAANTGVTIDIKGYDSAILKCDCGAMDAGTLTSIVFTLNEGDESSGSDKGAISSTILSTSAVTLSAVNTGSSLKLDLRGVKRYVTITTVATFGGGGASVVASAQLVLGEAAVEPAA